MASVRVEPAWIHYARQLFLKLSEQAELNEYHELIWEGRLLNLYRSTGASNGDYSRIMKLLVAHGVVRYVQRGNRHQITILEVTGELPPGDLLPAEHLTPAAHAATLGADELGREVKALAAWRESLERGGLDLAKVVQNFELRLTALESALIDKREGG